jgi:hypothetical protein
VSVQESEMKPIARTNEKPAVLTQPQDSPFTCDMTALDAEGREKHAVVTRELTDGIQEVRELPDGYALRFTPSHESILLVSEFIAREKLCCPFFSFELVVEKERGPVWLQLRGREGVKAFIQAELKIQNWTPLTSGPVHNYTNAEQRDQASNQIEAIRDHSIYFPSPED